MTFQPSALMAEKVGVMLKASCVMRPESLVSLSEMTSRNGLSRSLAARPGMAAKASLASPSMDAPSETVQMVTRSFLQHLVGQGQALRLAGRAEPSGPLLKSTPCGLRWDSPCPVSLLLDAAKALQILEGHAVEAIIAAQGINAVFRVAGVVDEIVGLMPGRPLVANMMP